MFTTRRRRNQRPESTVDEIVGLFELTTEGSAPQVLGSLSMTTDREISYGEPKVASPSWRVAQTRSWRHGFESVETDGLMAMVGYFVFASLSQCLTVDFASVYRTGGRREKN